MVVNLKDIFKKYYLLIGFIIFLPFLILTSKFQREMSINRNYYFDTSNISGIIYRFDYFKGGTYFFLNHQKGKYFFSDMFVYEKQISKDEWLYDIAEKGDSIYKAAYSDTLFLYRQNGKNYFFVFDRERLY